jgi:Right handed beta helix region
MMGRPVRGVLLAATTLLCVGLFGASAASATTALPLKCGEVVEESVTLTANLNNCPGNGLIVGGENITINLAGHTISGSNGSKNGVDSEFHSNVTIENGTVRGFGESGILVVAGENVTINNIAANGNGGVGILTILVGGTTSIARSTANGNGADGIDGIGDQNISIAGSTANGNAGEGIGALGYEVSIAGSTANGNGGNGIHPIGEAASVKISVAGSTANGNGRDGILIESGVATLTMTTTNGNGGHGVVAPSGATASGAKASGNGTPPQCVNVVCDPPAMRQGGPHRRRT